MSHTNTKRKLQKPSSKTSASFSRSNRIRTSPKSSTSSSGSSINTSDFMSLTPSPIDDSKSEKLPVDAILALLHRIFGEKFTANKDSTSTKQFSIYIGEKRCVQFSIHMGSPPEIHIDYLDNCTPLDAVGKLGTGSHTIQLLVEFTRALRSEIAGFRDTQLIIKVDASRLYIHSKPFSLSTLYILTRGESWYNSLGFYENGYEINRAAAEEYIKRPNPSMRPPDSAKPYLSCGESDNIQTCYTSIFNRLKAFSKKSSVNKEEETELKYYMGLITNQTKILRELFPITENRYNFLDLHYRF